MKKNVEEYIAFKQGEIRMPSHLKVKKEEKTRIYDNKIIEYVSRSPFGVPHTMWVIISVFFFWYAITGIELQAVNVAVLGIIGFLSWTFVEYMIHRFVYHTETNWQELIEFQNNFHMTHHHYPKDPERLAMPPIPGLIMGSLFLGLFYLILGKYAFAFFPGFLLGYVVYITLHYYQHRIKSPRYKPWKKLWQHHKAHHYSNPYSAFGVSTRFWDVVFGTMPKALNKKRQAVDSADL
jgi:sterol desaturase/sphingolipid hydroxylase (fatty acid hydroxylase superfamily)